MYSPIQFLLCRPVENFRYKFFSILKHYIYLSNTQINPFFSMFHFFIKIEKKEKERSFNSILYGKKTFTSIHVFRIKGVNISFRSKLHNNFKHIRYLA